MAESDSLTVEIPRRETFCAYHEVSTAEVTNNTMKIDSLTLYYRVVSGGQNNMVTFNVQGFHEAQQ